MADEKNYYEKQLIALEPVSYTHLDVYKRQVLERIENPLAAVTEERAAYLQQEKEFYTVLASKIRE